MRVPCIIFEDEHLLVANKPPGLNTHAPAPYAGEGLYDWLRHREPRWGNLAIIHRLDKETSGVIVFSKSVEANRSLTKQFEEGSVRKKYIFLTESQKAEREFTARNCLVRAGERYVSRPVRAGAPLAETRFRFLGFEPQRREEPREEQLAAWATLGREKGARRERLNRLSQAAKIVTTWQAEPLTGRTHQIRVHAAENGIPIVGDSLYGGRPAHRVFLHATEINLKHPITSEALTFRVEPDFDMDPSRQLRTALIDFSCTDSYRIFHGASDHRPGWYVDRLGQFMLSQAEVDLSLECIEELAGPAGTKGNTAIYHKSLVRDLRKRGKPETTPKLVHGNAAPERFVVQENGLRFDLSFREGYSVGIFLDQRDNRYRALTGHIGAEFPLYERANRPQVLNTFAYTCAFSVCAAKAGARVTSVDLSKKYLEWGRRNFR